MTHDSGQNSPVSYGAYYDAIASEMALYRGTSRRLVAMADLRPGMRVLDLACGTGLTAEAALDAVPEGLTLFLLDKSPSMIAEAQKRIGDRAAAYFTDDALEVASLIDEPLDRVLINMSLWQFADPEAVLRQVRKVLKPTGRLLFNMVNTYLNTDRVLHSPQWAFMQALYERGELDQPPQRLDRLPNQRSIEGNVKDAGFKPFAYEVDEIVSAVPDTEPGGELYNLLLLYPVPGLKEPQRVLHLLKELKQAVTAQEPRWQVAVFAAQPALTPEEMLRLRFAGGAGFPKPQG